MARTKSLPGFDADNFYFDVANNSIPGYSLVTKFGTNDNIGSTTEDIWRFGGDLIYLTAAVQLEVVSDSVNDTLAGTHARKVLIFGLDSGFNLISEELELNGTTASALTTQLFIRVYRAYVTTVGVYGNRNDGNISIQVGGGGSVQAYIGLNSGGTIGESQTQGSHYTIPSGHDGFIIAMSASVASNKAVTYRVEIRSEADNLVTPRAWRSTFRIDDAQGSNIFSNIRPLFIEEKTDIKVTAITGTSAECSFDYQIILRDLSIC